jgi:hypothetical protein
MKDAQIFICTQEPDYLDVHVEDNDWSKTVYDGDISEIIPKDILQPQGKYVTLSHYIDANLYHNMISGHSVTGILHFLNKTLIYWFSKKQATSRWLHMEASSLLPGQDLHQSSGRLEAYPVISWCTYQRTEFSG